MDCLLREELTVSESLPLVQKAPSGRVYRIIPGRRGENTSMFDGVVMESDDSCLLAPKYRIIFFKMCVRVSPS